MLLVLFSAPFCFSPLPHPFFYSVLQSPLIFPLPRTSLTVAPLSTSLNPSHSLFTVLSLSTRKCLHHTGTGRLLTPLIVNSLSTSLQPLLPLQPSQALLPHLLEHGVWAPSLSASTKTLLSCVSIPTTAPLSLPAAAVLRVLQISIAVQELPMSNTVQLHARPRRLR